MAVDSALIDTALLSTAKNWPYRPIPFRDSEQPLQ